MKGISVLLLVASLAVARAQVDQCPAEQETNWEIELLLRHEDCHKFYKCTFGRPVEYTCPSNLYFNLELWQCDWPHNVDCTGRNDPALTTLAPPEPTTPVPTTPVPTTPEPTTPEPTTPEPTTPEPTTPEPTTPEPTTPEPTTPEPTTTTTTTTTLAPTTTTTTTTLAPTTTTTTTTPVPTTTTTTTTTLAPTTTSSTTHAPECEVEISPVPKPTPAPEEPEQPEQEVEVDFLQNGCPLDPHVHWLLPNEEDCNLFYYCVWGEKVLRQCPATLYFNPNLQVCDWPQNAGCSVSVNKHSAARRRLLKQILL